MLVHFVRFVIRYLSLIDSESRGFDPFVAKSNVQVNAFGQPSGAVATKCVFYKGEGKIMAREDGLLEIMFDAGTIVTNPLYTRVIVCDAFFYEPSPADILRNLIVNDEHEIPLLSYPTNFGEGNF